MITNYIMRKREKIQAQLKKSPIVGIAQIGDNLNSIYFTENNLEEFEKLDIDTRLLYMPEDTEEKDFYQGFCVLRNIADGIIVQTPLPPQLDIEKIKNLIPKEKDVVGMLDGNISCVAFGIVDFLESFLDLSKTNIAIFGNNDNIENSLIKLLKNKKTNIILCEKENDLLKNAHFVITMQNRPHSLGECFGKPVIDAGFGFENGVLTGDCEGRNVIVEPKEIEILARLALIEKLIKEK